MIKMQQNSFFHGFNYSNCDMRDSRSGWSLCPVQDINTISTNRYGANVNANVDDTYSLLYYDLYLRQLKERLKHTMLVHESVFESQVHELHRLYRRQKELMMEMEGAHLNSSIHIPRTTQWMNSSVSTYQARNFHLEENIPNQVEDLDHAEKSEKKVLDLESPVLEFHDRREERGEVSNFMKEQSLEPPKQLNKLQLDLNEPAKIEEHSEYVFNEFLSPVTSNEIGEDSVKCKGEYGINLNMSPLSYEEEEEVVVVKEFETEKPPESLSVSLHGKNRGQQSRVLVQALPCLNSNLLLDKPLMRGARSRKKASNKTFKDSDVEQHSSAQATSESHSNQAGVETGSLSCLCKVKSARDQTNLGKKKRSKPQMNVHKEVSKKKRKMSRRISLDKEGNYQERSAAEAIVDMSRKSDQETSDCVSRDLLWFAEISSLVVEGYETDYLEAMTLQHTEMKLEEHNRILRSNSADNRTAVSNIVRRRQRRSRTRQGKRKCKYDQQDDNTVSECETDEDVQVIGKLIEASESKWNHGFLKNKSRTSPIKPIDVFSSSMKEITSVDWGATNKRRRGSRVPAADFQHMIINQTKEVVLQYLP